MTPIREMKRTATGRRADYVVTLRPDGVEIRPKRVRREEARVCVTWDWIYMRAIEARPKKRQTRHMKRGLL